MLGLCLMNIAMKKTCDLSWWKLIQSNALRFPKDLLIWVLSWFFLRSIFKNTWRNSRILNLFETSYMSNWKTSFISGVKLLYWEEVDHSSAFVAAIATHDNDDDGGHYCYFYFLLPGLQNQSITGNWKRYCQLYQRHGSIRLWSKNVGISRFSQGLCGSEINQDMFHW